MIPATELSVSLLASVFSEFSQEFGAAWDSRVSTLPDMAAAKAAWHAQIGDLTPAQIRKALDTMPVGKGAFPPGPRAFRQLALAKPAADLDPPYYQELPRDPPRAAPSAEDVERIRGMLDQMREAFKVRAPDGGFPAGRRYGPGPDATEDERVAFEEREIERVRAYCAARGVTL